MDKKTQLTKSIPGFMEDWQLYKKGLRGLKITDWCVSSDYCFDDPNKDDTVTFTIFPYDQANKIIHEIGSNVSCEIKNMTHVSDKCIDFIKNSPYFFHITIVIEKLKNSFQEAEVLNQIENTLKQYEINGIEKAPLSTRKRFSSFKKLHSYMKQKSHSKKFLAQIFFVATFMSQIFEFLLIKEKGRNPRWCSDRDHMAVFNDGLIFDIISSKLGALINNRIADNYVLHRPPEILENKTEYEYDLAIRIPDIITGIMSSMKFTNKGIQMDKPKHYQLFQELIANNPKIVTLEYIYQKDGKGYFQRPYWGIPIEGYQYKPFDPDNCKRFTNLPT